MGISKNLLIDIVIVTTVLVVFSLFGGFFNLAQIYFDSNLEVEDISFFEKLDTDSFITWYSVISVDYSSSIEGYNPNWILSEFFEKGLAIVTLFLIMFNTKFLDAERW